MTGPLPNTGPTGNGGAFASKATTAFCFEFLRDLTLIDSHAAALLDDVAIKDAYHVAAIQKAARHLRAIFWSQS